jgi:DNA polymerase I-like protein with 3'-5' exonuclease and polymerase domains
VKHIVFDIEGDGLLPELTKIHSLVLQDLKTGRLMSCTDNSAEYFSMGEGLDVLAEAERVYGHNILGYDIPALKKIYPAWDTRAKLIDTFTTAQLRWPHIRDLDYDLYHQGKLPAKFVGKHSLEAWGYRLGRLKTSFEGPWDEWSEIMQGYCEDDVGVSVELVEKIRKSGVTELSLDIEHRLRVYLLQQEENGWPFDLEAAEKLYATLAGKREAVGQQLVEKYGVWYEKDGKETTPKRSRTMRKNLPAPHHYIEGCPYQKIKLVTFNPGSRAHIAKVLKEKHEWVPTEFTETGLPKIDETVLQRAKLPEADLIVEYLTLDKRISALAEGKQAWLGHATLESPSAKKVGMPMIHHQCWQNFARTHRASHRHPNMSQVPTVTSPYGVECRSLFTVPKGWVLLGADASGLELRCLGNQLAPYDGGVYSREVVHGDVHTRTRDALGFPETAEGRYDTKTFTYATLYGAGNEKKGSIRLPKASKNKRVAEGKRLSRLFEQGVTGYKQLDRGAKAAYRKHGYVRLLDGRRAYPKKEYSSLNTLLQGDGSIICKLWIVTFADKLEEEIGPQGWAYNWAALLWSHDEVQIAVRPEHAETAGRIITESIAEVRDILKVVPELAAEFKIGGNWSETH